MSAKDRRTAVSASAGSRSPTITTAMRSGRYHVRAKSRTRWAGKLRRTSGVPIGSRSAYRDPWNSTGSCLRSMREPAPWPSRHSSRTTPRSFSISASLSVARAAKSPRTTRPRSTSPGLSVGTSSM